MNFGKQLMSGKKLANLSLFSISQMLNKEWEYQPTGIINIDLYLNTIQLLSKLGPGFLIWRPLFCIQNDRLVQKKILQRTCESLHLRSEDLS